MARFKYKAYTSLGRLTEGTVSAVNLNAAIDALYSSGLTPFETVFEFVPSVAPTGSRASRLVSPAAKLSSALSVKDLATFTRELASLTASELPIDEALRIVSGPGSSTKISALARDLLKDVVAGMQLSEAIDQRRGLFSSGYLAILKAGEITGEIAEVLGRLADMLEQQVLLRQKITAALIYPAILVAMSLVSIGVIVTVLIPSIDPIFADTGVPLPGILRVLTDVQNHWFALTFLSAILLIGSIASGRLIRMRPQLAISIDRVKCRLPILGPLLRARDAAACARALGTLLSSGVPLMTALENSKALVKNSYLAACYQRAISRIPEGTSFHIALADSALFSAAALRIVAVGEETGKLGTSLLRTATLVETDLQQRIERLVTVLTPMLTLCVGGSIGFLVMEVMSAVLSINDLAFK